jgi:probable phosphoglycerate mutase
VAQRLAGRLVDAVFSSPLGRAQVSARMYADALSLPVVVVDELAGLRTEEIDAAFPGALTRRAADKFTWRFPEGESYADGDLRAGTALEVIAAAGVVRPLIVSHEMIGRMLLRRLLDITPAEALAFTHPHGQLYRIDVAAGTLQEIGA